MVISDETYRSYQALKDNELLDLVRQVREISKEREERLKDYEEMLTDSTTQSAVELLAEDATQVDEDKDHVLWIRSNDADFEKRMNDFLYQNVDIDKIAFSLAFNIVAYGEVFLNTFYSDPQYKDSGSRVGEYFELETPTGVTHIYRYGKPSGYHVKGMNNHSSREITDSIISEKDYIHFIADQFLNRDKVTLKTIAENGDEIEQIYTIHYGSSFLEAARASFRTRVLLDNILLLSRLSRSQFYRLFSIEVGNADSIETDQIIKDVRDAISTQRSFEPSGRGLSTVASPMSTGGNVYIPTREGKGSTDVKTSGGEVDVRAILDVDRFDNQYFGALKVPKQFLGCSEDMPGGLGDTTLTRLDIRYARTCKRIQTVIKNGVKDLIDWYCSEHSIVPAEYEVCMTQITTADDDEKAKGQQADLDKVDNLIQLVQTLNSAAGGDPMSMMAGGESQDSGFKITEKETKAILKYVIKDVYGDKLLYEALFGKEERKNEPGPVFEGRDPV